MIAKDNSAFMPPANETESTIELLEATGDLGVYLPGKDANQLGAYIREIESELKERGETMIPEEDDTLDPDWKPFKVDRIDGGFQVHMLGNISSEMKFMSDALIWAMEVMVDAWIHHLNIEHDLEDKTHKMPE